MFGFLKRRKHDKIAKEIAAKKGMLGEYLIARGHGCSPLEALEEWDLITEEEYELFE